MKNLRLLIFLPLLLASFTLFANTPDTLKTDADLFAPLKRPYIMSFTIGKLMHTGGNPGAPCFGRRKSVNTEVSLQMAVFFNKYIGAYGSIAICGDPWKEKWEPGDGYDYALDYETGLFSSTLQAGAIFRYEIRRWQFYARLGTGFHGMASDVKCYHKSLPDGAIDYESDYIETQLSVFPCVIVGGLTFGFRASRAISLVLDVDYRHRIGKADEMVIEKKLRGEDNEDIILERSVYRTKAFGKELSVRLGFQLQCELSGSRKKKK